MIHRRSSTLDAAPGAVVFRAILPPASRRRAGWRRSPRTRESAAPHPAYWSRRSASRRHVAPGRFGPGGQARSLGKQPPWSMEMSTNTLPFSMVLTMSRSPRAGPWRWESARRRPRCRRRTLRRRPRTRIRRRAVTFAPQAHHFQRADPWRLSNTTTLAPAAAARVRRIARRRHAQHHHLPRGRRGHAQQRLAALRAMQQGRRSAWRCDRR